MKFQELVKFIKSFNIEESKIKEFTNGKTLREISGNIYLIDDKNKLQKNQIHDNTIIYIKLNKLLPTKFILEFIKNNSKNIIELINEKQALQYTYGKPPLLQQIKSPKLQENKNYIVIYKNQILGYCLFLNKFPRNQMNIGEYLKEN